MKVETGKKDELGETMLRHDSIMKKGTDGKVWPVPRQVITDTKPESEQRAELKKWLDEQLSQYIEDFGTFKFDKSGNLMEQDFLRIYDLIESVGRFELKELRE